ASVYASNAPGGIVNMVSKTGGAVLEGNVKLTTGTTGMFRTDLDVGGPMGSDWFFHVGGFYRTDDGVRETGFTGNKGGQIKANLTRVLDNGILRFYVKELNDRNIFYLPIPLQDPDNPSGIPGFDPNEGTMTSSDAALVRVPDPAGNLIERDLTDGMHPQVSSLGLELDLEIGEGWNMNNNLRYIDIDMQFNAIFSLDNPFDGVGFADDTLADYQAANPGSGAVDWRYTYATTGDAFSPANANGNGLVARTGWWFVDKPMTNFADKLQFSKTFGAHNVTFGVYFSDFDVTELWHWSDILTEVKDDPRMLNLELVDAGGNSVVSATENGFLRYGSFYVNHRGEGQIFAGFIGDEAQITDKLRIDAGLRYEFSDFSGSVENGTSLDLGDPTTLADDNFSTGDGSFRRYNWDFDEWAGSLGFNYSFTEGTAVFGRLSRAFRTPDFEQWIFASPDDPEAQQKGTPEEIQQAEVGLKYLTPYYAIFASGYLSELENIPFNDQVVDPDTGEIVTFQRFAGSQTVGLEVEAMYRKDGLGIDFRTTYQNAEYEDFADLTGNQVRRVPELLIDFRPSYQIDNFNLSATWRHYDDRFANDANTVTLPSYDEFHAAVAYHLNKLRFTLSGANLTNEIGLTEGNPRVDPSQVGQQDVYMARPILGRSFNFSVAYSF
ncbi:MAG: TonB-dependent receptor, partial [Acidobacteriota bacterium]|nr:TonB-dependent receptor [Acidobacteriota bacterium]